MKRIHLMTGVLLGCFVYIYCQSYQSEHSLTNHDGHHHHQTGHRSSSFHSHSDLETHESHHLSGQAQREHSVSHHTDHPTQHHPIDLSPSSLHQTPGAASSFRENHAPHEVQPLSGYAQGHRDAPLTAAHDHHTSSHHHDFHSESSVFSRSDPDVHRGQGLPLSSQGHPNHHQPSSSLNSQRQPTLQNGLSASSRVEGRERETLSTSTKQSLSGDGFGRLAPVTKRATSHPNGDVTREQVRPPEVNGQLAASDVISNAAGRRDAGGEGRDETAGTQRPIAVGSGEEAADRTRLLMASILKGIYGRSRSDQGSSTTTQMPLLTLEDMEALYRRIQPALRIKDGSGDYTGSRLILMLLAEECRRLVSTGNERARSFCNQLNLS